jgi:hypothetical protein
VPTAAPGCTAPSSAGTAPCTRARGTWPGQTSTAPEGEEDECGAVSVLTGVAQQYFVVAFRTQPAVCAYIFRDGLVLLEPDEALGGPEQRREYAAVHSTHAMNEHIRRMGRGATFDEEQWGRIKRLVGEALGKAAAWLQLAREDFVTAPQRERANMLVPTIVAVKVLVDENFKPWLLAVDSAPALDRSEVNAAMAKVANRDVGFDAGRQKRVLERGTNPKLSRRTCVAVSTGYNPVEGNRWASRNGRVSDLPTRNPSRSRLLSL